MTHELPIVESQPAVHALVIEESTPPVAVPSTSISTSQRVAQAAGSALDLASAAAVAATAPPTSNVFSASRRVLFFISAK
jgi:hypothetical protein